MNTTLKAALAALLAAGATSIALVPAQAQVGDQNTTVTGGTVRVQEQDADLPISGHDSLNINGAVGLPLNPTANTTAQGSIRVQGNYYQLWRHNAGGISSRSNVIGIYAAGAVNERFEVSGGLEKQDVNSEFDPLEDALDRSGIALGVKYLVGKQQNPEDVRFAVGAGFSRALYKNQHLYGVASKNFGTGKRIVTGHLGLRWDRFKVASGTFPSGVDKSSKLSAFAGVEVPIDSRGRFNLVGELQTKNANSGFGGSAPYSVSVRYQSDNGFSASVGMMRQGVAADFVDKDRGLFAQVGKTF